MTDDPNRASQGDVPNEPDDAADADVRNWVKGALGEDEAPRVDVLAGVQKRLRERSGGKFYADEWSTAKESPMLTYLATSALMLVFVLVAYAVLAPLRGAAESVSMYPKAVDVMVMPAK